MEREHRVGCHLDATSIERGIVLPVSMVTVAESSQVVLAFKSQENNCVSSGTRPDAIFRGSWGGLLCSLRPEHGTEYTAEPVVELM